MFDCKKCDLYEADWCLENGGCLLCEDVATEIDIRQMSLRDIGVSEEELEKAADEVWEKYKHYQTD